MILRIDHVGIATDDPAGVGSAMAVLGMHLADDGVAEDYRVSCQFWQYGPGPAVEVVAPVGDGSAIANRLGRDGPGLYHLALEVDDLDGELTRLRGHGFVPVDARPCAGARAGMRVAFVYLRRPANLLIELVQYDEAGRLVTRG